MASGIYFIRHRESGKMYVGSAQNVEHRLQTHQWKLERGQSVNSRLAKAFEHSTGWAAFETGLLEECAVDLLAEREQHWVDTLKPRYNIRLWITSNRGATHSDEARANRREWATKPEVRQALNDRLAAGRKKRWETSGAVEQQSEMMRGVRAKKLRSYESIQALVAEANPQWSLQSASGTKTKDKITIYCAKHDTTHVVTVNMLVSRQQGCKACGWERSAAKQQGIVKPSLVARWDREGRKTEAELKAQKAEYDRERRQRQKEAA